MSTQPESKHLGDKIWKVVEKVNQLAAESSGDTRKVLNAAKHVLEAAGSMEDAKMIRGTNDPWPVNQEREG